MWMNLKSQMDTNLFSEIVFFDGRGTRFSICACSDAYDRLWVVGRRHYWTCAQLCA
jgi:hypothetical protein